MCIMEISSVCLPGMAVHASSELWPSMSKCLSMPLPRCMHHMVVSVVMLQDGQWGRVPIK